VLKVIVFVNKLTTIINKQSVDCDDHLASTCPFRRFTPTFWRAIFSRKVKSHWTNFWCAIWVHCVIDRSVHARLQVSVCSSYDLCHHG